MNDVSVPTPSTPPAADSYYPLDKLALFNQFTSFGAYRQQYGHYPPGYNRTLARKYWFDSTALNGHQASDPYTYSCFGEDTGQKETVTIVCGEAAAINIDDHPSWPPYIVAKTDATVILYGSHTALPVNPATLSSEADAQELLAELQTLLAGHALTVSDPSGNTYPADEPRRAWTIFDQTSDNNFNAGELLQQKYQQGIGAPGKWVLNGAGPEWQGYDPAAYQPADASIAPVPMPMRDVGPGESIVRTNMPIGPAWQVHFTPPNPGNPSGGGSDVKMAALLQAMATDIAKIKIRLGIS